MSEDLDILKTVAENPSVSQRKIAERTGISLGQVNFLIKKCVKKGLIKIEGQTTKSIKYNLTPKGLTEITALTLEYIKLSYGAVIALTDRIRALGKQYIEKEIKIYVYGSKDEMYEIVNIALGAEGITYIARDKAAEIKGYIDDGSFDKVIFYWEPEVRYDLAEYNVVNILEKTI